MDRSHRLKYLSIMVVMVFSLCLLTGCPDSPGDDGPPPESCSNTLDDGYIWVPNEFFIDSLVFVRNDDFEHAKDVPDDMNCWNARIWLYTDTDTHTNTDPDTDVFKVWLKAGNNRIRLTNLTADLELHLYNSQKNKFGSSEMNGTTEEIINLAPSEDGYYYIVVFGYQGSISDYTIILSRPLN